MSDNVTAKQKRAVEVLTTTGSATAAAEAAGVSRKTLYVWLKQPAFVAELREAERQALETLSRRLVSLAEKAAEALAAILDNSEAGPGHKIRAAAVVLDNFLKVKQLYELESRIAALEAMQNDKP